MAQPTATPWMTQALDALGAVVEVREPLDRSAVAEGYAAGAGASERDLHGATELNALSHWVHSKGGAESAVVRSRSVDGVFALDPEGFSLQATEGVLALSDGRYIVDARRAPQRVLLERDALRLLIELGVSDAKGALLAPDLSFDAPAVLVLPEVLSMRSLLSEMRAPEWLDRKFERFASGALYSRVALVATAARLWPSDAARVAFGGAAIEQLSAGHSPWQRAQSWLATLSDAQREAVVVHARRECELLEDDLDALIELVTDESAAASAVASRWLERRDDLESVSLLIAALDGSDTVRASIDALDARARSMASTWGECGELETEQLAASASEDPGSWWTDLL
jgi:hypothetical protein